MSARKSKRAIAPQLLRLESRDVPATFYVDPTLSGSADGSTQTFNAGQPNQMAGLVYGSTEAVANAVLFPTLAAALNKAAANAEADTILLANGDITVDNSGGRVEINDQITLTGSGRAVTTLKPTTDDTGTVMLVNPGKSLSVNNLGFDGTGKTLGSAFFVLSGTGNFNTVQITNVRSGDNQGTAIAADFGSYVGVVNAVISGYDRIGVSIYDSMGSVYNSTITGLGDVAGDFVNYGVQVAGNSRANLVGNTITQNRDTTSTGEQSAGVYLFEDVSGAPHALVTTNNFANNTYGALIGFVRGADNSTATITRNNFAKSNAIGIVAENNTTVDARRNYWGAGNGPNDANLNPNGLGTPIDDQVDYSKFLRNPFEVGEESPGYAIASGSGSLPVYGLNGLGGLGTQVGTPGIFSNVFGGTWAGDVRVGTGDVNGDNILDVIVGIGAGGGSRVQVYDGATKNLLMDFNAYVAGFTGGVYVASGDVNGDGKDDIITGAGFGGGPHVKVFDATNGAEIRSFYAFGETFTGGVTVASGDFNNDTFDDVVAGTATGTSRVTVFSAFYNPATGFGKLQDFLAYGETFTGGVFVAAGDLNGDGRDDLITGAGFGGGPHVRAWASNLNGTKGSLVSNFLVPGLETFTGGIRVAAQDLDDDGCEDIILGTGPGAGSDTTVRVVYADNIGQSSPTVNVFAPWGAYANTIAENDGLYVG